MSRTFSKYSFQLFGSAWVKRPMISSLRLPSTRRTRPAISSPSQFSNVGRLRRQRAEHQAAERGDAQLARAVLRHVEVRRHAALAVHAVAECDRAQIAAQIIAPGMIDALEVLHRAAVLQADQRAAMRTAIFERAEFAVLGAHHDDRHAAYEGGAIVADVRQLDLEAEVVPDRAFEDALLFRRPARPVRCRPNTGTRVSPAGQRRLDIRSVIASIECLPRSVLSVRWLARQFKRGSGTRAATSTSTDAAPAASNAAAQAFAVAPDVITSSISSTRLPATRACTRRPHRECSRHLRHPLGCRFLAQRCRGAPAEQGVEQASAAGDAAHRLRQHRRLVVAAAEQPAAMQRHRHQQVRLAQQRSAGARHVRRQHGWRSRCDRRA